MVVIVGKNKILVLRLWPLTKEVLNTQVDILCSVDKILSQEMFLQGMHAKTYSSESHHYNHNNTSPRQSKDKCQYLSYFAIAVI